MPELKDPTMLVEAKPMPEGTLPTVRSQKELPLEAAPAPPPPAIPELTVKKIALAISAVMNEIGIISKQGYNEFHRYRFAAMQDILQKVTPLLAAHGLVILQTEVDRAMFDNGRAIAIKYAFTIMHTSGEVWPERLTQTGTSRCMDSKGNFDDKALNKCHTAARKYFLLALFQIATGDEDDADNERRAPPTRKISPHDPSTGELNDEIPEFGTPQPAEKAGAPPHQDQPRSGASAELLTDRLMRYDHELKVAAEGGTEALRRAWLLIPPSDRTTLEAALRNRHKPRAAQVDASQEP